MQRLCPAALLSMLMFPAAAPAAAQTCDFIPLKQDIDRVVARETEKFKAEVKSGSDSPKLVSTLASAPT